MAGADSNRKNHRSQKLNHSNSVHAPLNVTKPLGKPQNRPMCFGFVATTPRLLRGSGRDHKSRRPCKRRNCFSENMSVQVVLGWRRGKKDEDIPHAAYTSKHTMRSRTAED